MCLISGDCLSLHLSLSVCLSVDHPSALAQAREELRPVREDFEAKNKQLLDEMPKFYQSRIDYFQPSFEALIRAQVGDLAVVGGGGGKGGVSPSASLLMVLM